MDSELQGREELQEALMADDAAYNNTSIIDKQLEPSVKVTPFVTRNQSLGNLDEKDFRRVEAIKDEAMSLIDIPYSIGGWLGKGLGVNLLSRNELTFVMSGSKAGYVREILATRKAFIQRENKESVKTKAGLMDKD